MINELKRFILTSQEGNLTRTAEKIFITQSALSQSIHRLEKELKTKLFVQKGKQLELTEDGKALIVIGEKILQLWSNAHDQKKRNLHIPTYTIGIFDNAALKLGKFFQKTMQSDTYKLELIIDSSGKLLTQLQLGVIDAAVCVVNKSVSLYPQIELLQTFHENLLPVSSVPFTQQMSKIPFILYNRASLTRLQIDEVFINHGIQPTIYAESTSVTFMRELALLGCGVALLPENFIQQDVERGELKIQKIPFQLKREYGLFIQKQHNFQTSFITDLQKALAE